MDVEELAKLYERRIGYEYGGAYPDDCLEAEVLQTLRTLHSENARLAAEVERLKADRDHLWSELVQRNRLVEELRKGLSLCNEESRKLRTALEGKS